MFGLFRKKKRKDLYRVEFVQCGRLDREKAEFELGDMRTEYVEADHLIDAQKVFASKYMITPHVYIHRISKIDRILRP